MSRSRVKIFSSLLLASLGSYVLVACIDTQSVASAAESCATEVAAADEDILKLGGKRYKIIDGAVYSCHKGKWVFGKSMLAGFGKRFEVNKSGNECTLTVKKTGKKKPLVSEFSTSFEQKSFRDLFKTGGWSITTLLSPKANNVKKYMKLNRELMKGGKFRDNRMDLVTRNVRSGKKALKFHAVKPGKGMKVSKALIEKKDLCFAKGDHVWFSGWYYLKKGMPATLLDIETRRFEGGPGMRIFIRRKKFAGMELKFADKPQYNQYKVAIPRKKWFNMKLHLYLSNKQDGIIELWQDGKKILSAKGKTLPTHDTIYNAMQIGITATPRETTLLIDDVKLSKQPL